MAIQNDLSVEIKSNWLIEKEIAFIVSGGISSIDAPKIIRELRRFGANVHVYVTEMALNFVGKMALEWASANPVQTHFHGLSPHISHFDGMIICPATTDSIAKIANGLCNDVAHTLMQSALGLQIPLVICPAMHDSLKDSVFTCLNIEKLKKISHLAFIKNREEEGKFKLKLPEEIAIEFAHLFNKMLRNIKIKKHLKACVTLGGTAVKVDNSRCITNFSTGSLGKKVALALYGKGVEVTLYACQHKVLLPNLDNIHVINTPTYEDLKFQFKKLEGEIISEFDGIFHLAAVSDYQVTDAHIKEKIASGKTNFTLELVPTEKLIALNAFKITPFKAACKLTSSNSRDESELAVEFLKMHNLNACFWNTANSFDSNDATHSGNMLIKRNKQILEPLKITSKSKIAEVFSDEFLNFTGDIKNDLP